jgi:acetoin:2,6-dichlorophenolindophenol oxidoreductase subunit alpha
MSVPTGNNDIPDAALLACLETMRRIRVFEETALYHSTIGNVHGPLHLYIGEEAVAAGVSAHLRRDDYIASTHRGHGHAVAKGADLGAMMAELFGRADGACAGKGGSQHIAEMGIGMLGANGIVGAGFGLAAGAAIRCRQRGQGQVSVVYFGDGATARGTLHEVLNLAALWTLPLVFVCENNGYAQWVSHRENMSVADVHRLAQPFDIPACCVDGNNVRAVYLAAHEAIGRARRGEGASFIECKTHRYYGHTQADMQVYRSREEVENLRRTTDPIAALDQHLAQAGLLDEVAREAIETRVRGAIETAVAFALSSPYPVAADLHTDVVAGP